MIWGRVNSIELYGYDIGIRKYAYVSINVYTGVGLYKHDSNVD